MSADRRRIVDFHNVVATASDKTGVVIRFSGRNSAGTISEFTVHLDWWAWPMLVKYVAKHWIQERVKRFSEISDIDNSLPLEG